MESLHAVTRVKAGATADLLQSAEERGAAAEVAARLGWAPLHRLWQLMLKGLQDVAVAPDPHEAATMALLRLIHAADLPDPAQLLARLTSGEGAVTSAVPSSTHSTPAAPTASQGADAGVATVPADYPALVAAIDEAKPLLGVQLRDQVALVRYVPGELVVKPLSPLGSDWPRDTAAALKAMFGPGAWQVSLGDGPAAPSLRQQEAMAEEQARAAILDEPIVKTLLEAFPDAALEDINRKEA
jgi:DNA polymerase-3 subunit gamma/tau